MEKHEVWGEAEAGATQNVSSRAHADSERERVRVQFYATYDVMTGVRIAATLGGFFALMVFLIVYKSRSKSVKALNDPKIVEMAEAVVAEEQAVEEERQLSAALEEALEERARSRSSIGELPPWPRTGRFASYGGGYGSLLAPPRRLSTLRGDSLPCSSLRFSERRPSGGRSRRLSSATWSSSGSSYLERRGSSAVCALPERRLSPCPSERLAPLASVGSAGPSHARAREANEPASLGTDSVFADPDSTDDEVDQFSTDSGGCDPGTELATRPLRLPPRLDRASHSKETLF